MNDALKSVLDGGLEGITSGHGGDGFLVGSEGEKKEKPAPAPAADRRAESNRRSFCQPCKRLGVLQVAHRIDRKGDGMCAAHFRGELVSPPKPAPPKTKAATPQSTAAKPAAEKKENTKMPWDPTNKPKCKECGVNPIRSDNKTGVCTKCKTASSGKRGPYKKRAAAAPVLGRNGMSREVSAKSRRDGETVAVHIGVGFLDSWWRHLTIGEKAEIFEETASLRGK